jgi:site-specific DNA-methyltransferase (adenine-specific)
MSASRVETIGNATLYLGDCRDVLPTLGKVDAVVSDPPYGIAHRRGKAGVRTEGRNGGAAWSKGCSAIIGDAEPFDASHLLAWPCVLWGANYYGNHIPPASGSWLVWDKVEHGGAGDFSDAEIAWCSRKGATKTFRHMWMGVQRASETGQARQHPTQKPIELMAWSIGKLQVQPGSLICDPYMGSGTTGVAAVTRGFLFVGIEIEPAYFDIACKRIEDAQRQGSLFGEAA